jgi:chaperonin GroES
LVGVKKEKNLSKEDSNKLPQPTGWRMLVLPFKMKEKTKGGVILAETTLERQQVASQCGLVLRMGPDCYKDKERYADGPWCKEGEWVMFARYAGSRIKIEGGEIRLLNDDEVLGYAGSRIKIEGGEIRLLNDDEVLATIKNPEDILHEY